MLIKEIQYFNQWWIILILLLSFIAGVVIPFYQTGDLPIISLCIFIPVIILISVSRLKYSISEKEIRYKFFPFIWRPRIIHLHEVEKLEAVFYKPLLEYGGWGFRYGRKGWSYTTSGKKGIRIKLKSGKRFLIGTQKNINDLNAKFEKIIENDG